MLEIGLMKAVLEYDLGAGPLAGGKQNQCRSRINGDSADPLRRFGDRDIMGSC